MAPDKNMNDHTGVINHAPTFNLDFPHAWGAPTLTALLKVTPEDFYVEELLGFEPCGSGEHLYLFIEKRNHNTQFIAEQLARAAKIKPSDVSYAGMKDRRALTRQWFSLYLPKPLELDWQKIFDSGVTVLRTERHSKKLRRGEHSGNFFRIRLYQLQGDLSILEQRFKNIVEDGVPNYFGGQRFGNQTSNLQHIEAFLAGAKGKQRGFQDRLKVSAMRSWLFNLVLAERVRNNSWCLSVAGDPETVSTGPLWGRGRLASADALQELERQVFQPYLHWCHFLEHCGLQQERRNLVLKPEQFTHHLDESMLELEFSLPAGGYATVLLREISHLTGTYGASGD